MAYFNHAYRQTWVPSSLIIAKGTATSALKKGELAFIDAATYESVNIPSGANIGLGTSAANGTTAVVGGTGTTPNIASTMGMPSTSGYILAQGNFNLSGTNTAASPGAGEDTIGTGSTGSNFPMHGGYAESYKSKIIIPKFITGLYKDDNTCGATDTAVIDLQIPEDCFKCDGSTSLRNQIRIDVKGNAVLRYLNRFAYSTFYSKDCDDCPSDGFQTAAVTAADFVKMINDDPIVSPFVTATAVAGSSGNNKIRLTLGYTATFFDNCSFDTRDNVDTEPLQMTVSILDEDGDACVDTCITGVGSSGGTQAAMPDQGITVELLKTEKTGENVLRDLILDRRYSQDGGHNQGNRDSARFRQIEKGDNILAAVDRTATYRNYKIQHTVPRYNNPTGVFDNDQYLYEIHVPCDSGSNTLYSNIGKYLGGLAVEAQAAGRFVPVTTL